MINDLIIDAKIARQQHEEFIKIHTHEELQKIMKEINDTIKSEKTYIIWGELSDIIINKLNDLGYHVTKEYDGYSYKISW